MSIPNPPIVIHDHHGSVPNASDLVMSWWYEIGAVLFVLSLVVALALVVVPREARGEDAAAIAFLGFAGILLWPIAAVAGFGWALVTGGRRLLHGRVVAPPSAAEIARLERELEIG